MSMDHYVVAVCVILVIMLCFLVNLTLLPALIPSSVSLSGGDCSTYLPPAGLCSPSEQATPSDPPGF